MSRQERLGYPPEWAVDWRNATVGANTDCKIDVGNLDPLGDQMRQIKKGIIARAKTERDALLFALEISMEFGVHFRWYNSPMPFYRLEWDIPSGLNTPAVRTALSLRNAEVLRELQVEYARVNQPEWPCEDCGLKESEYGEAGMSRHLCEDCYYKRHPDVVVASVPEHLRNNPNYSNRIYRDATRFNPMRPYVNLYRDGDAYALSTNITDERVFVEQVSAALVDGITSSNGEGETQPAHIQLAQWLPQAIDVVCKLRGYKAPSVEEQRVLTAGRISPRDTAIVATSVDATPIVGRIEPESASA